MDRTFGQVLRQYRQSRGLSLAKLGKAVGCSAPKLYKLEHDSLKKAVPAHFVKLLCGALSLSISEQAELFRLAGYQRPEERDVKRIADIVEETLHHPDLSDSADDLIADVEAFIRSWSHFRRARRQDVRKLVIAAAGWQPRLLSMNRYERTLLPAVHEAVRAEIGEVILIVPPSTPDLHVLRNTFSSMLVTTIVQQEPLGLGHALLAARTHVQNEPFAVLLADEIDESGAALRGLLEAYRRVRKPLVAVDFYTPTDNVAVLRYFGFAKLGTKIAPKVFALQEELIEKPVSPPTVEKMRIAGRYVLTPEILQELHDSSDSEQAPVKHDLTAAINRLWRASNSVLAYKLDRSLLSIAPYRHIIEMMDGRKAFNARAYNR